MTAVGNLGPQAAVGGTMITILKRIVRVVLSWIRGRF
jgi:hypothetical protein